MERSDEICVRKKEYRVIIGKIVNYWIIDRIIKERGASNLLFVHVLTEMNF